MKKKSELFTFILLILIAATALTRITGFNNPHNLTFDEALYNQLAAQLKENPLNYTSRPTYKYYTSHGRILPEYLNRPLFKHPPLYPYLVSLTFYFTAKPTYKSAWSVSLISGVLLILLIYFLGKMLYDQKVGIIAALLLFLDPTHWLTTQKLWMETTVALLIWISLFLIIKAAKDNHKYFYWAGITTGCAILTKYTAFLIFPIGLSLIFVSKRTLLKSKHFWSWPLISFFLFLPWLVWNYKIYGASFLGQMIGAHGEIRHHLLRLSANWHVWVVLGLITAAIIWLLKRKKELLGLLADVKVRSALLGGGILLLFIQPYMAQGLVNMFNLRYVPPSGWVIGMFGREPWCFYLRRLIELSPFYILSFGSFMFLRRPEESDKLLITISVWILTVSILWGNYQSRYILSAVPALLLLSGKTIVWAGTNMGEWADSKLLLSLYRVVFVGLVLVFLTKTVFIDLFLALPNKTCYF